MAEEEIIEEVPAEKPKTKSKIIAILMYSLIFLVGIVLMIVISNMVFNIRNSKIEKIEREIWAPATEAKAEPLKTFSISTLQVNLSNPTGDMPAMVRTTMALGYKDAFSSSADGESGTVVSPLSSELEKRAFEIRDKLIQILSSKSIEDLDTPDKQLMLKQEIINQINSILINGIIQDVYFTDFNFVKTTG